MERLASRRQEEALPAKMAKVSSSVKISGSVADGVSVNTAGGGIRGDGKQDGERGAPWVRISLAAIALASAMIGAGVIRGCTGSPLTQERPAQNDRAHG